MLSRRVQLERKARATLRRAARKGKSQKTGLILLCCFGCISVLRLRCFHEWRLGNLLKNFDGEPGRYNMYACS